MSGAPERAVVAADDAPYVSTVGSCGESAVEVGELRESSVGEPCAVAAICHNRICAERDGAFYRAVVEVLDMI